MFDNNGFLSSSFGISSRTIELLEEAEKELAQQFERIDNIAAYNQAKVLCAFQKNRVSYAHFGETTGYGYDDLGRDTLDKVYADAFGAEDALVRHNIVSGTQAIASCLYGILRPGDVMLSVAGMPYDTLEEVIGVRGDADSGSLKDFGIDFEKVDLKSDGTVNIDAVRQAVSTKRIKLALIQRSCGYAWRNSLSVAKISEIISCIKNADPNVVCLVDNCYGEFAEKEEPIGAGADIIVGSLIKNPGGSLALSGGYIAGRADLIEKISYRLTAPGLGRETGASLGFNRNLYQGFFVAPHVVAQSLKTSILCAKIFEKLGFDVCPKSNAVRTDIIQSVKLKSAENIIKFCAAIQKGSPIDSYVTPEPWDMPGYEDQVIMAAGAFVQGASIELSADAPIAPPYIVYMQGGIVYDAAKIGILLAADAIGGN